MADKKRIMIDEVLYGGLVEFSQGEFDDPVKDTDFTRKPELDVMIRCEFYRQTTAEECAATLMLLSLNIDEIEKQIITNLNDMGIRQAIAALHFLLSIRRDQ